MKSLVAPFRDEHEALAGLASELREAVNGPEPADPVALFHLRRNFSQKLTAHLHGEDWVLYPRLRASSDPRVAAIADRFSREMAPLTTRYLAYARTWTSAAMGADWLGFRAATIAILDALAERMAREDRELYACADGDYEGARKAA